MWDVWLPVGEEKMSLGRVYHKTEYMQTDIFTRWFRKYIEFSHATKDAPVFLIWDGHSTHIRNVEVIELARENVVVILCFPSHCTHEMQPLDVGFNGPLNMYFGKHVASFRVATAKMSTAVNSFEKCGIFPFNLCAFDGDFADETPSESHSQHVQSTESQKSVVECQNVNREIIKPQHHLKAKEDESFLPLPKDGMITIPVASILPLLKHLGSTDHLSTTPQSPLKLREHPDELNDITSKKEIISNYSFDLTSTVSSDS
ncbi:hypothetical protein TKK_0008778 [Trichogramma kaykai]